MIAYYAMGGGLGHLTRARAVAHTLGIARDVTVLTASAFADDPRVRGPFAVERVPKAIGADSIEYRAWLSAHLAARDLDGVIVDAFPGGLFGELCGWRPCQGLTVWHVARRVRWSAYRPRLRAAPPRFGVTFVVEALEPLQSTFLEEHSDRLVTLALEDPPAADVQLPDDLPNRYWLIAHAGSPQETRELIAYALETRAVERCRTAFVVATPHRLDALPPDCRCLDVYPATALVPRAERVFTAAGFNSVRQMAPWRDKHWMLPFPRALDDQFARKVACGARSFS
jgi:hypothetical protein